MVAELDEERVLADVGGHAIELEPLEACPAEKGGVRGDVFAEALDEAFVVDAGTRLLRGRDLRRGMLADGLVRWPVRLLTVSGLDRSG